MKKIKYILNLLTTATIAITLSTGCGNKNNSSDSTKTETSQDDNFSKIKQNVKDYICKKVIYFPESYESLKFVIDTVYVNTDLIAEKKEKESTLEKDKTDLTTVEKFIKNYDKVASMIKNKQDADPTNAEMDAYGKGSTYYSKERNHLENLKTEIINLPLQIAELNKQIEQNKNVIKSYNVFHAFNAKDKENKLSVTEVNIILDKDFKVINYKLPSASKNDNASANNSHDCGIFIKDYEAFVNSYIKVLKKYKANPNDATILSEYTDALQKASEMQTNAAACTDLKYASKLLDLNNKLAQAAQ